MVFKKILLGGGLCLLGMAAASLVFVFGFPSAAFAFLQTRGAAVARLEEKELVVRGSTADGSRGDGYVGGYAGESAGEYVVSYYEGGSRQQGPPLLLLHGLGDEKNSFVRSAALLTDRYNVFLPDLPGHGQNARDSNLDYSIRGQVELLRSFVHALGLERIHLGGSSLGGQIAAAYAARYPRQVERLILLNPPGLQLEEQEPYAELIYSGFDKRMESREEYFTHLGRFVATPPPLPGPIVDHLMDQLNDDLEFLRFMADAVQAGEDGLFEDSLANIQGPTLILWGKDDGILPFEVALGYEERISGAKLTVIQNSGHFPHWDQPAEVGQEIRNFLLEADP